MRVLVCGSRHFDDWELMSNHLYEAYINNSDLTEDGKVDFTIIEGGAKGADFLGRVWAKHKMLPFIEYHADWKQYGPKAGPIRNQQMLDEGKPDLVIAFLFPNSRGTKDMISRAEKAGIKTKVINCA